VINHGYLDARLGRCGALSSEMLIRLAGPEDICRYKQDHGHSVPRRQ
jgi:hypothetical protein